VALEEFLDRRADAVAALGGEVGPGMPGVVVEHHPRGLGEFGQPRPDPARARPVVAGHDQETPGERRQGGCIQHRRAQQRQGRDPLRLPERKALQIGRAASGKMRANDPEMIEELGETGLNRRVVLEGCKGTGLP